MNNEKKIIGVIPARGGSKGIPGKNTVDVCGRPLIDYSIEFAKNLLALGEIDKFIVTTDDKEIAKTAKICGAEVPFLRPKELANDQAKTIDVVKHVLDYFENRGESFDAVLLLQPTSPLRNVSDFCAVVLGFFGSSHSSMISCYLEEYISDCVMYKKLEDNSLKPRNIDHAIGRRRQDIETYYVRNGAIYLTLTSHIRSKNSLICDNPMLLEMSKISSLNLDAPDDLELLRAVFCK